MAKVKEDLRPLGGPRSWARTNGTYLAGQAAIDGADSYAMAMEQKWGAGRLRLLVDTALREKFDRQRFLYNSAIWHGELEDVRRESARMVNAWTILDLDAEAAGALPLDPVVWETTMPDGTVVALVRSAEQAHAVVTSGRRVVVYTLDEVGWLLQSCNAVTEVKEVFPGATVEEVRRTIGDPLDGIRDGVALDDPLDDLPRDLN